jgi:hypothetical protein
MTEFYRSKQNIEEFYINIHCQPINPHLLGFIIFFFKKKTKKTLVFFHRM